MKKLLIGNQAVAAGLHDGGLGVVSSYPGTPSTEITEFLSTYDDIHSEWAPNEKVAAMYSAVEAPAAYKYYKIVFKTNPGAYFELDEKTGKCTRAERVEYR